MLGHSELEMLDYCKLEDHVHTAPAMSGRATAFKGWLRLSAAGFKELMLLNWETHTSFITQLTAPRVHTWLSTNSSVQSQCRAQNC